MKTFIRPADYTWWLWLLMTILLLGLLAHPAFFPVSIILGLLQSLWFLIRHRSLRAWPVQLRVAYLVLLVVFYLPPLRVLYWIPAIGTLALCFFGYCLLARMLSLFPWNRSEPLTLAGIRRTFLRPPSLDTEIRGQAAQGCPGGVCTLEVQLGRPTGEV